jgi:hypothetical protein
VLRFYSIRLFAGETRLSSHTHAASITSSFLPSLTAFIPHLTILTYAHTQEFDIDIVSEHGKVVHRKVAARVACAFTPADTACAIHAEQRAYPPLPPSDHPTNSNNNNNNNNAGLHPNGYPNNSNSSYPNSNNSYPNPGSNNASGPTDTFQKQLCWCSSV